MVPEIDIRSSWQMAFTMGETTMIAMRVDMGNLLSPHYLVTLILIEWIGANL
jgi:hypothetical protein